MFDVFNMTLGKYHIDLEEEKPAKKAVRNWFSSAIANERRRKVPSFLITSFTFLADAFYEVRRVCLSRVCCVWQDAVKNYRKTFRELSVKFGGVTANSSSATRD